MQSPSFRFVQASDFRLELPLTAVAEAPQPLADLLIDAPYQAAGRLLAEAIDQQVDFVVLAGGLVEPRRAGPRSLQFLHDEFSRLAEAGIAVYWSGGQCDRPREWPAPSWPDNVTIFPAGRCGRVAHVRQGQVVAQLVGRSRGAGDRQPAWFDPAEFQPLADGNYCIAVVAGELAAVPADHPVDYWAIGGSGQSRTLRPAGAVIHDAGPPQGRSLQALGVHGGSLVEVGGRQARITPLAADVARWHRQAIRVEPAMDRAALIELIEQEATRLAEDCSAAHLVEWIVEGQGSVVDEIASGSLAAEVLGQLRQRFGRQEPPVWSLGLEVGQRPPIAAQWYEQDTLLGDFLRAVRQFEAADAPPVDLDVAVPAEIGAAWPELGRWPDDGPARRRLLDEVARLGAALLAPEADS